MRDKWSPNGVDVAVHPDREVALLPEALRQRGEVAAGKTEPLIVLDGPAPSIS